MKRTYLLSAVLCLSMFLCGCTLGGGESQFTQMDSQYLQEEKMPDSQVTSESEESEAQKKPDDKAETESDAVPEKDTGRSEKEKKTEKDSASADKKEKNSGNKSEEAKKANSKTKDKTEQKNSQKEDKKNGDSFAKNNSAKKEQDKKQPDKSSDKKPVSENTPKPESTPDTAQPACIISIDCHTILANLSGLKSEKKEFVPEDGWILKDTKVLLKDGDTAYDVLYKVCKEYKIHIEAAYTPAYGTYYVEGIHQLYEFDCGDLSGWSYLVNGQSLNYGCSKYVVKDGDVLQWRFSCNAGRDVK